MKVTIVHTNNKKQLLVSTKTTEKLLQRIAKDDSRLTVTHFREYVTYMKAATNITRICQHGYTSTPLQNSPKTKTTT